MTVKKFFTMVCGMEDNTVISFANVGARYDTDEDVLTDVSFNIGAGSFYFLSGASGAGEAGNGESGGDAESGFDLTCINADGSLSGLCVDADGYADTDTRRRGF